MSSTSEVPPKPGYWIGFPGLLSQFYAWLLRRMPTERQRLLAVTILAGGLCGLAAVAFHLSIGWLESMLIDRANAAAGYSWIWWTILTPGAGRTVCAGWAYLFCTGSGGQRHSPGKSRVRAARRHVTIRETIGKFVLCAVQIGSGASLGLEGPDRTDLRGRQQPAGPRCTAEPQELPPDGLGGHGGRHRRGFQRAHRRRHLYAGGADRRPGPDHALRRHCGRRSGRRGREHAFSARTRSSTCIAQYTLGNASSLVWYALLGVLAAIVSVAFTDSLLGLRARFKRLTARAQVGASGHRRRWPPAAWPSLALEFFHLNGIAGDPYKTLTLALTGTCRVLLHDLLLRAQAGGHRLLLFQRRRQAASLLRRCSWAPCWAARSATRM